MASFLRRPFLRAALRAPRGRFLATRTAAPSSGTKHARPWLAAGVGVATLGVGVAACDDGGDTVFSLLSDIKDRLSGLEAAMGGGKAAAASDASSAKHNVSAFGGVVAGDCKDTDEFKYFTYPDLPKFTAKHKSAMSKRVTRAIWERFKDTKTASGYSLHNAIQTGVETPHLGVGITAGDEESWETFKDVYYPIIKDWHGWDPRTNDHESDLDYAKIRFSPAQRAKFDAYVASTRVRAARNVSGFTLPAGASAKDRLGVEAVLARAFGGFTGDLKGTYYKLGKLNDTQRTFLRSNGFLFQKPKTTNLLTNAGAARSWPDGRGIFHNDSRSALCWVNEEDHCRIISMSTDGNVAGVFERFCKLSQELQRSADSQGTKLMHHHKLGYLGTCPSNLGTGLRASVMICLPELNKDVHLLEKVCAAFDLQPRGSAGEHSAAVGAKWDISNKQRIGFSEVQLVQKMIDGVAKIIAIEEKLAAGGKVSDRDLN